VSPPVLHVCLSSNWKPVGPTDVGFVQATTVY
jgi:hypothetical protein